MRLGKVAIFEKGKSSVQWKEISKYLRVEETIFTCLKSAIQFVNQAQPSIFLISQSDQKKLSWKFIKPLIKSHLNRSIKTFIVSAHPISDPIFPVIPPVASDIIQSLENTVHEKFIFESLKKYRGFPAGEDKLMLGESPAMIKLYKMILRRSNGNENCLIYGESGVGKTLATEALHFYHPNRSKYSIETLNVTEIHDHIFEAEFFGAKKGSYTGCDKDKLGFFDKTQGTLFIDEIGNLPLLSQSKLLRAIGDKKYKPVGSQESKNIGARLVFATNKNLKQMVLEKEFMEDLLFRIEKVLIHIPSLRERKEDIPLLVDDYVNFLNLQSGKSKRVPDPVKRYLTLYSWPGNIRELHGKLDIAYEDSVNDLSVEHFPDLKIDFKTLTQKAISPAGPVIHLISLHASGNQPETLQGGLIDRIKETMIQRSVTQKELANKLNIAKSTVSMWFQKNSLRGISEELIGIIEEWIETGQIPPKSEPNPETQSSHGKIKKMLAEQKLGLLDMANALRVSKQAISKWLRKLEVDDHGNFLNKGVPKDKADAIILILKNGKPSCTSKL
ncbi:MAG: sigma 54-interacting transcriptional regulator [Nitrospiria bacterium]